jgi:putative lipoprotein
MRTITGQIVFPSNAPKKKARLITIELHDMSVADAPSKMLTQTRMKDVQVAPNEALPFKIKAPEASRGVAFRVHVDWDGDGKYAPGDLLTTQVIPVPAEGQSGPVEVPVTVI